MSDPTLASSVVDPGSAPTGALALIDRSDVTKLVVRAPHAGETATALATAHGRSRRAAGVTILGQRPTEWLLVGERAACDALAAEVADDPATSVIDLTHGRCLFELRGADGPRVMEKINGLDWSDPMMPDGAVTGGSVAKVMSDLARQDVDGTWACWIAADRSFGQYLFDAIADACREFAH